MTRPNLPQQFAGISAFGWLRAAFGALLGIGIASFVCRLWLGADPSSLPYIVAPVGASAVLVFALPASPLAQPWPVLGGNTVSALMGVLAYKFIPEPSVAAGCAVAGAIAAMSLARCLHPPGGAVALTGVIGSASIHAAGWSFALVPVALNTAILVGLAWIINNATRHSYPHRAMAAQVVAGPEITLDDIDAALDAYDEMIDVSHEDLLALFRAAEGHAEQRSAKR